MSGQYTIRKAVTSDRQAILQIAKAAYDGVSIDERIAKLGGEDGELWRERKAQDVAHTLESFPDGALVATTPDGQVVAFVTTEIVSYKELGHVVDLAVQAAHRGKGVGRRLLEQAIDYLRRQGVKYIKIETLTSNPAGMHLYPDCGFVEVARQIHYAMVVKPD